MVAPFYKALNAEFAKDAPELITAVDRAGLGDVPGQRCLQQPR